MLISGFPLSAQLSLDLETGGAFNTFNEVRYPNGENASANKIEVAEEIAPARTVFFRARLSYTINEKHTISALYAPLKFESTGNLEAPKQFGAFTYNPDESTEVIYRFNSYRLTYRYRFVNCEKWNIGAGLTGKIRDARVALNADQKNEETTDLGFVPLINFNVAYIPSQKWTISLKGDALVGSQGRAEDVFAGVKYEVSDPITLKVGYRILEGGADVDQVYNFSLIHYAAIGAIITL